MRGVERLLGWLEAVGRVVVVALMALMLVLNVAQAVDRYLLASGFFGYDQYAKLSMVALTFLCLPLVLRQRRLIAVDFLDSRLTGRLGTVRSVVFDLILIVLLAIVFHHGLRVMEVGAYQVIVGTPLTYWTVYLLFNIGMAVCLLFLVVRVAATLLSACGRLGAGAGGRTP